MELRQLRHFVAVVDARSFSVAARELRLSQPALTRSIGALEQRVGARLFERSRRGTRPSAAGLELYRHATILLNDCERAAEEVAAIRSGGLGKVSIGVGASYVGMIEEVVARAAEEMPSLEIEVVEGMIENLVAPLSEGRIDIILTTFTVATSAAGLVLEPLVSVAPMIVAGAQHPLARRRTPAPRELAGTDWVSIDQPYTLDVLARLFTSQRLQAPVPVRCNSLTLVKSLVASGEFLALLPERAVAEEMRQGRIVPVPIPIPVPATEGGIVYLDRPVRSAATERVIQLMREAGSREGR